MVNTSVSHPYVQSVHKNQRRNQLRQERGNVVCLHEYRHLSDHPEQELEELLKKLLATRYQYRLLEFADDYALAKAGEVTLQVMAKGFVDRDEYYDAMIAWALSELADSEQARA